jgi:hypothetical protein
MAQHIHLRVLRCRLLAFTSALVPCSMWFTALVTCSNHTAPRHREKEKGKPYLRCSPAARPVTDALCGTNIHHVQEDQAIALQEYSGRVNTVAFRCLAASRPHLCLWGG